jgi:hypothetical protein
MGYSLDSGCHVSPSHLEQVFPTGPARSAAWQQADVDSPPFVKKFSRWKKIISWMGTPSPNPWDFALFGQTLSSA